MSSGAQTNNLACTDGTGDSVSDNPLVNDPLMSFSSSGPTEEETNTLVDLNNNNNATTPLFHSRPDIDDLEPSEIQDRVSGSNFNLPFPDSEVLKEVSLDDVFENLAESAIHDEVPSNHHSVQGSEVLQQAKTVFPVDHTETVEDTASQVSGNLTLSSKGGGAVVPISSGSNQPGTGSGRSAVLKRKLPEKPTISASYHVRQKDSLLLDAYIASIGPHKIKVSSLVLSANEINIRVEKNIVDSRVYKVSSVNTLVLPKYEIIKILAHFRNVSTSALFIYISPSLAPQVYNFIQKSDSFRQNSTTRNVNGYNLVTVLLHTMSHGKSLKCQEVLTKFGTKENPVLQCIEFETAGEYIKACFSESEPVSDVVIPSEVPNPPNVEPVNKVATNADVSITKIQGPNQGKQQIAQNATKIMMATTTAMGKKQNLNIKQALKGKTDVDRRRTRSEDKVSVKNIITIN